MCSLCCFDLLILFQRPGAAAFAPTGVNLRGPRAGAAAAEPVPLQPLRAQGSGVSGRVLSVHHGIASVQMPCTSGSKIRRGDASVLGAKSVQHSVPLALGGTCLPYNEGACRNEDSQGTYIFWPLPFSAHSAAHSVARRCTPRDLKTSGRPCSGCEHGRLRAVFSGRRQRLG